MFLDRVEDVRAFLRSPELADVQKRVEETCDFLKRFSSLEDILHYAKELEKQTFIVKEFLSIEDVARYLQMNKSAVYKLTAKKQITFYKPGGKTIFIRRSDLEKWIGAAPRLSAADLESQANLVAYQMKRRSEKKGKRGGVL